MTQEVTGNRLVEPKLALRPALSLDATTLEALRLRNAAEIVVAFSLGLVWPVTVAHALKDSVAIFAIFFSSPMAFTPQAAVTRPAVNARNVYRDIAMS